MKLNNMEEKKQIYWNVQLWKWYFTYDKNLLLDNEKDKLFNIMVAASGEDIKLFMRFFLYVANSRNYYNELAYKTLCHFISLLYPDMLMTNIELFLTLAKKDDLLYLMPNMHVQIMRYIKHKVKEDEEYKKLLTGELINNSINRVCRYKPKKSKTYKWSYFLLKLISDTSLNGINTGTDFDTLNDYLKNKEIIK